MPKVYTTLTDNEKKELDDCCEKEDYSIARFIRKALKMLIKAIKAEECKDEKTL